jgi:hypothetical protein
VISSCTVARCVSKAESTMSLIAFKSLLFICGEYTTRAQARKHGRLDARLGGLDQADGATIAVRHACASGSLERDQASGVSSNFVKDADSTVEVSCSVLGRARTLRKCAIGVANDPMQKSPSTGAPPNLSLYWLGFVLSTPSRTIATWSSAAICTAKGRW